ncbi:MAG: undecaprenyl/decaprenyl-phosphate alpha-N-acetylglucosaminyl 1-phosphate transferase [Clostridia bacterium]|nr:undecaprenyl/decaprenyl-phosphate alpha-N-acetylglucosaminyl 1-phosphate transferase [Clostridia bacterium]
MKSVILVLSPILTYLAVPATERLARFTGAVDRAGDRRKIHLKDTPRLGGLSFFSVFFLATSLLFSPDGIAAALLAGGAVVVAAGVADDTYTLPAHLKLALQFAAAAVALSFIEPPSTLELFSLISIPLAPRLAYLFSLVRIVFLINAVNFSDGLDGLAAGLATIALFALSVFGFYEGKGGAALIALILALTLTGFLPHNRYHAKTFMGDCGSQFLGFAIATLGIHMSESALAGETALFIFIPILDVWFSTLRRILRKTSPFRADKGHVHHLLISHGVSHPTAVRLLLFAAVLFALAGLVITVLT